MKDNILQISVSCGAIIGENQTCHLEIAFSGSREAQSENRPVLSVRYALQNTRILHLDSARTKGSSAHRL
jgi:hypothetical protein